MSLSVERFVLEMGANDHDVSVEDVRDLPLPGLMACGEESTDRVWGGPCLAGVCVCEIFK